MIEQAGMGGLGSREAFEGVALLLSSSALLSWANARFLRLPGGVGMAFSGLLAALLLSALGFLHPELLGIARAALGKIDFSGLVFNGLLALLLFAGAMHVDWGSLKASAAKVAALSTVGVILSCLAFGALFHEAARLLGIESIGWAQALLLGALISPTDPVAALALAKGGGLPERVRAKISGESLFNDAAALLLFALLLPMAGGAASPGGEEIARAALKVMASAVFGALLGMALGALALAAARSSADSLVALLSSLALACLAWALAEHFHFSGPLAVVCAGLVFGQGLRSRPLGLDRAEGFVPAQGSREEESRLGQFWEMSDEILNAAIFSLMGLELLLLDASPASLALAGLAILAGLMARGVSVAGSLLAANPFGAGAGHFGRDWAFLVWGGMRGAISVALALSLPADLPGREALVVSAYAICVFSILAQGLSMGRLSKALARRFGPWEE